MYSRCVTAQIHSTKLSITLNISQLSPKMNSIYSNVAIYFALFLMTTFLLDSHLLLISAYQALFFALFAIKMYRDEQFRRSDKAKSISRLLTLSYVLQLVYVLIAAFFYSSSNDNIVYYYDPVALLESPLIVISIVQTSLLVLFISKLYIDLAFRRSRRAKWIMMAFALICSLEIIHAVQKAITFSSENSTGKFSVYYQKAQSDLGKPSSGLEHALGEDDGFDFRQHREQVTLLTNAVLKVISEVKENKSPDFKAAGVEWFGEKEKALYLKSVLKEAEECFSSGVCGSALTLVDTILGREEVEQTADLAGGESHPDPDPVPDVQGNNLSVSWKKVAFCGLTIYAGYSVYRGEMPLPAQVRNLYDSWKGVIKSTLEERVYNRLKFGK
jgi:hypothetical protein